MWTLPLSKRAIELHPCFQLFVCKGLLALFSAIGLRITAALAYHYMFAKDCGPHFLLFVHKGLRPSLPASIEKDCCPYFCFCLQRIVVLVFCYSFCFSFTKDCDLLFSAIHSQRTAVLVYLFRLQRTAVLISLLFTK